MKQLKRIDYGIEVCDDCNMECTYCYVRASDHKVNYTWESVKKFIDMIFRNNSKDKDLIRIEFLGGEPLLPVGFKRIQEICEYIHLTYSEYNYDFLITTNGSIYTADIVEFINSNHIQLCISIDGIKSVHDACRRFTGGKPSHNIVFENAMCYNEDLVRRPILHLTVSSINALDNLIASVQYLSITGFNRLSIGFAYSALNDIIKTNPWVSHYTASKISDLTAFLCQEYNERDVTDDILQLSPITDSVSELGNEYYDNNTLIPGKLKGRDITFESYIYNILKYSSDYYNICVQENDLYRKYNE